MGLKLIQKTKPAVEPIPEKQLYAGAEYIDKVGQLAPEALKISEKIKALQKQLLPYATALKEMEEFIQNDDGLDPDFAGILRGEEFQVEVGKKGNSRSIKSMEAVREAMTDETFMKVAKVTLSDMDKYLTGIEVEQLVETSRTKRTIKPVTDRVD